jgi:hypothetical protein
MASSVDLIIIVLGVIPMAMAMGMSYVSLKIICRSALMSYCRNRRDLPEQNASGLYTE